MPLNSVSAVHLWNEIQKSKDIKAFLMKLDEYRPFHPEWKSDWIPALKREHQIASLWQETPTKLMLWLALSGFPTKSFQETFNLSPKDQQSFERLATSLREVAKLDPLDFHGEFEEVSKRPEFEKICDVFFTLKNMQAKESGPFAESLLKEFAPGWQYLFSFEIIKDVREIDPPLRAKYQVWNLCQKL